MRRTAATARNRRRPELEASCSLRCEWQPVAVAVDKGVCRPSLRSRDRSRDRDRFRERLARRKIRVCIAGTLDEERKTLPARRPRVRNSMLLVAERLASKAYMSVIIRPELERQAWEFSHFGRAGSK